ncbi:hypothetical protein ACHAXT_004472 [Thalassiosira profunda]
MCRAPSDHHDAYRWRGDLVYGATLLNTVAFMAAVLFCKDSASNIFDAAWAKEGFCVANATIPYWSSHDLCLYADLFLAGVCGVVYYLLRDNEGMQAANHFVLPNILGVAAHGLGHGGIGAGLRDEKERERTDLDLSFYETIGDKDTSTILYQLIVDQGLFFIFWLLLLKAAMPESPMKRTVLPLSIVSWISTLCTKPSFQFTSVQTILQIAFALNQLCRPKEDKGYAYFLYGAFVAFPLGIVGWLESILCSSTIIHLGGHLCYDAFIPVSMLAFYLTAYVNRGLETAKLKSA